MRKPFLVTALFVAVVLFFVTCKQTKKKEIVSPVLVSKYARPLTNIKYESTTGRVNRGKYLVNGVLRCFHCHAPADTNQPGHPPIENMLGGGRLFYGNDSIKVYAPNITPDKETGAGNWTDDMFVRALRDGIGHDGRALGAMPWWIFKELSEEDMASVVVYLRSIPPVKNKLPVRLLMPEWETGLQNEERSMKDEPVPEPDTSTLVAKGRYLVTIGECEGCHTAWYVRNPGYFGGGNIIAHDGTDSVIASANITSDTTGVGTWDDKTFIRIIRTGKGNSLHYSMPWIAFRNINDTDLKAMLAALKTIPPVKHRIVNGIKPSLCEVCGQKHGYGDNNKITPILPVAVNTASYQQFAGTYTNKYKDTTLIALKEKKLWVQIKGEHPKEIELIPVGKNIFNGSGLPSAITFITGTAGNITGFVNHDLVAVTSLKINTEK
ncbi:MAG: c-type cytochrome [Sphingobacteriales bacterium]|nr:c-type cytochrome [Sphingobacteriales bacterium]